MVSRTSHALRVAKGVTVSGGECLGFCCAVFDNRSLRDRRVGQSNVRGTRGRSSLLLACCSSADVESSLASGREALLETESAFARDGWLGLVFGRVRGREVISKDRRGWSQGRRWIAFASRVRLVAVSPKDAEPVQPTSLRACSRYTLGRGTNRCVQGKRARRRRVREAVAEVGWPREGQGSGGGWWRE